MSEDLEARSVIKNRISNTEILFFFLYTLQNIYFITCFVRLNFWKDIVPSSILDNANPKQK